MKNANQGDVHIWRIDTLPEGAVRAANLTIREGETTGHAHRLTECAGLEVYALDGRIMAVVGGEPVTLTHEEHRPITLPPGIYEFGPTHEYDYDKEESAILRD